MLSRTAAAWFWEYPEIRFRFVSARMLEKFFDAGKENFITHLMHGQREEAP